MSTESIFITVSNLPVEVVRKDIKNLHLGVYPPDGHVRVAVPLAVNDEAVRLAVIGKLGWIRRQRARFDAQPRQTQREMVGGESHYFQGRRYRLRVHEEERPASVVLRTRTTMDLYVRPGTSVEQREKVLQEWYRRQMKTLIPPLLEKWQPIIGVEAKGWGIKRMKTKWGTCTSSVGRIWFNLELAKKTPACLEYIVVHELVHLLVPTHDERFTMLMDKHLSDWRMRRAELNGLPLAHEVWESEHQNLTVREVQ